MVGDVFNVFFCIFLSIAVYFNALSVFLSVLCICVCCIFLPQLKVK